MRPGQPRVDIGDLVCWLTVASIGLLITTQAIGWAGTTTVAIAQSLTPYLAAPIALVVLLALWRGRLVLVTAATAVGFGIAVLGIPLAIGSSQPSAADGATGLRVASLNLWYANSEIAAVAEELVGLDTDLIVFSEYTPEHRAVLQAGPLADSYRYRIDRQGLGGAGVAVWSRVPMQVAETLDTFHNSLDVVVDGPDGAIRVVAMHMPTPILDFAAWRDDLAIAAEVGRETDAPTLLIGDLNATYWHPDFRRVLDTGFVDAHTAHGAGFSTSWPIGHRVPPFVRIDHALTTGGLVSTDVVDIDIPGSDHRGLVVTVAPARSAAP